MKIDFEVENLCQICCHFLCGACGCPYNDFVICKDSSDCLHFFFFFHRKNLFMKEKLNKKKHKLYTLFTIYTSDIVG